MDIDDISYEQQETETEQTAVDSEHQPGDWQDLYSIEPRGEWFHLVSFYHLMIKGLFEKKLGRFIPSKQVAFDVIG